MSEARNTGRQILIDIIDNFSPDKFIRFFREKNRAFAPRKEELNQYGDDNFRNGIKLGEIQFAQDEKMLACAFEAGQPLSERSGKKAQYEKGKKILKDTQSDAGIFIFHDAQGNFRFSLIYANYLGRKRDWSVFRRFTYFVSPSATNKTFLKQIGEEDFSSLEKIKEAFSVEKVTKAFYSDIANWYFWAVSKTEFPKDAEAEENGRNITAIRMITRLIFIWFMKERGLIRQDLFNYKNISTLLKDLSPKNTTYYKAILQNLFFATLNTKIEDRKFRFGKSFQGKNKDYMDHGIYRYEDYFKNKEDMLVVFKDIPFLNGGLFDCLDRRTTDNGKNVEIRIDGFTDKEVGLSVPNQLFFSDEITVDLNKDYGTKNKKYKVRGLIDILSSYNFTIDENDPNDADVALDPELLGKVFENLLASFNPETATTARKQTGSFYTPREIVNYMVDESLIAYLSNKISDGKEDARVHRLFAHTDEPHQFSPAEVDTLINAIDNAKILDPACGSGAFPMGILHKLVHALGKLDPDNSKWKELQKQKAIKETEEAFNIGNKEERIKRLFDIDDAFENNSSDYGRKLYLIENCIFGVDIQPIAVQIAKLRFFISLLVDQNVTPPSPPLNKGGMGGVNISIRPLPNLETKFVAANTLIGIERPAQGLLRNPEIDRKEAELHRVRERHFTARTPKIKQQCIEDDKKLRAEISGLLKRDGFPAGVTEKLANWNPYDQNASADFFDPEWMFGVTEGFDIVIGNPPYVEHKKLKSISSELKNNYSTYSGTADLYVYFYETGIRNLRENGILVFITSNKFIKTSYGENLRNYFIGFCINEIIDFTDVHVFEALVSSCIFSVSKRSNSNNKIKIAFANDSLLDFSDVSSFIAKNNFYLRQSNLSGKIWQLENETKLALKEKIESSSVTMQETGTINIYRGVTTGYNPAFIIDEEKRKELIKEDKASNAIIKPLLQGRNIKKWNYFKTTDFLIFTRKGIQIKEFPAIKRHLQHFKEALEPGVGRKPGSYNWYEIQDNTAYYPEFEKEKIIWGLTADKWAFAYDKENHFLPSNGYILTSKVIPIKYLLALMNSKLMEFYFGYIGIMTAGGAYTLKYETVIEFPIKIAEGIIQRQFITLVDQILAAKSSPPLQGGVTEGRGGISGQPPRQTSSATPPYQGGEQIKVADTSALEKQIDEMVYALYGLTSEEIAIVEGKK